MRERLNTERRENATNLSMCREEKRKLFGKDGKQREQEQWVIWCATRGGERVVPSPI